MIVILLALLQAHEIGTSRVSAQFHADRTYVVEIVTDATALVEELEAGSGRPPLSVSEPDRLLQMLRAAEEQFRKKVTVRFDTTNVRPNLEYKVVAAINAVSAPAATIRLTGQIPDGAQQFAWSYGWTYATYALTIHKAGDPETVWLEGDQRSKPLALASITTVTTTNRMATIGRYLVLGFTHIVPLGLDHMLFVLGIYLSSALLIGYFMVRYGKYRWAITLPVAIGVPLLFFLVFERWFLVPLAKGPLERLMGL